MIHPLQDNEPGIIKLCQFPAVDEHGNKLIEIFTDPDQLHHSYMDKVAAPFLPQVREYIDNLNPDPNSIYALVNALGAYEYWSSNINGDAFEEEMLIHRGPVWGYETFLVYAKPFMHHANKGPNARAFGAVELSCWHDRMKRVELVVRLDRDAANQVGAHKVIDRIDHGQLPDTSMGCFTAGTLITMGDWTKKPIEDVRVGDTVITHRGRARKVTEVHERKYSGDLYSVKPEGGRLLRTTRQHPFLTETESVVRPKDHKACPQWDRDASLSPEWVEARRLQDQFLLSPVADVVDTVCYDVNLIRLLGFYLAEGYPLFDKKGSACGICLCTGWDDPIHDEIDEICEALGLPEPWAFSQEERSGVYIHIFDTGVAEFCISHAGRGAASKKLSPQMLSLSTELVLELLGKYGTGDGCFSSECLSFSTSSEDLAWQLAGLLPRVGVVPSVQRVTHKAGSGFSNHDTYEWIVHIGKSQAGVFRSTCSKVGEIDLVKPRFPRAIIDGYVVSPLREVSRLYVETDVYNLEVEEDESYLAEGQAVHNCKVPYDLCSITTDWELYRKALATYNPKTDRHPGMAVLRYHKTVRPIPGVSITRNDYSDYLKTQMNQILPDGRKVCAFNPYPRFFDISFVFIGADKTSKMMAKIASRAYVVVPSSYVAESYGYNKIAQEQQPATHKEFEMEKAASVEGARAMLRSFKKRASQRKRAEIIKEIVPSQFGSKAVPILEGSEKELPKDTLNQMGSCSMSQALSTPTMLGMTLKPREFQRIILCRLGKSDLADKLDDMGKVFRPTDEVDRSIPMGSEFISSLIGKLLKGAVEDRSALGPVLKRRMIRITIIGKPESAEPDLDETKDDLLDKVSAAYNGYREQVIEKIADLTPQLSRFPDLQAAVFGKDEADIFAGQTKEAAGVNPKLLLGAVPATYLMSALARHKVRKDAIRGRQTGLLTEMLADHPHLAATAVGMAALKASGSDLPDRLLKGAITVGKRVAGIG